MLFVLANIVYFIVIALHLYFMVLEMALWKKRAPKLFGITPEFARQSAALASNQGLYNGFLAVALLIGFFAADGAVGFFFMLYGLLCVIVAGIWGGVTVNKKIAYVQAVPALIALVLQLSVLHF